MLGTALENVRGTNPLIHCITNYVTVNDVANVLLACGASPVMADDEREVAEIASIAGGLCLNIGTLNARTADAMLVAGRAAGKLGRPVLLDPVGAGASQLRTDTARKLVEELSPTVIRGNISELKALVGRDATTKGVDAADVDAICESGLDEAVALAKGMAAHTGSIVVITGAIDIVADASVAHVIRNGHPLMSRVTGTGCMLSALATAFVAANPAGALEATAAAVSAMGLAGEIAHERMEPAHGNATYRSLIIDSLCNMDAAQLDKGARHETR